MTSSFSVNLIKWIGVAALVTLGFTFAGNQGGLFSYSLLHAPQETETAPVSPPAPKPAAVKKVVAEKPMPRRSASAKPKPVVEAVPVKKAEPVVTVAPAPAAVTVVTPKPVGGAVPAIKPKPMKRKKAAPVLVAAAPPTTMDTVIELGSGPDIDTGGAFAIQTGVFLDMKYARENAMAFRARGYDPAFVVFTCSDKRKIYSVRIGNYATRTAAEKAFGEFKKRQPRDGFVVPLYSKADLRKFCKSK